MFHYVYVLESIKDDSLYVGRTSRKLNKRLEEHNQGLNFSTKHSRPWRIIYSETCLNEQDAIRREKYFKTSQGRRLLKRRLKEFFYNKTR